MGNAQERERERDLFNEREDKKGNCSLQTWRTLTAYLPIILPALLQTAMRGTLDPTESYIGGKMERLNNFTNYNRPLAQTKYDE